MRLKTALLVLCIVVVNACSPQVAITSEATVTLTPPPAETAIPTPTLHPQFSALQEQISEIEGYKLTNDGMIMYEGDTIPGLQLTADGRYVVVVGDEMLIVDPEDVHFGEDGEISIDGYELDENGGWVEAMSETVQEAMQHFADLGYPTDGLEFREGEVTVSAYQDGLKVFEMNIKSGEVMFDQDYVEKQASQMKLDPSDLGPREDVLKANGQYHIDATWDEENDEYIKDMKLLYKEKYKAEVADFDFNLAYPKSSVSFEILDPEINAWGVVLKLDYKNPETPRYFYYRDETGKDYLVPLMPEK